MNKIFRIVWSQATQSWVVVSELTKAHKKQSSSNSQKSAVKFSGNFIKSSAIALTLLSGHSAYAAFNATGTGGADSVAFGESTANGAGAVALGKTATASMSGAVALGAETKAQHNNAVAIGKKAQSTGDSAIALGFESKSTGDQSVAIGLQTNASNKQAVAVGYKSQATGDTSVALGGGSNASAINSISIGNTSAASGNNSIALGSNTKAKGATSVALGSGSNATGNDSYAIGWGSSAIADYTMAFGNSSKANKVNDIALGKEAETRDQGAGYSVAIGAGATSGSNKGVLNRSGGDAGGVAIGTGAFTGVNRDGATPINSSVAVGAGAGAGFRSLDANNKMPAGNATDVDSNEEVLKKAFGVKDVNTDFQRIAGGTNGYTNVDINEATALGRNARAIGDQSVAIGAQTIAGMGAIALGGNDITQFADKKYYKSTKENFKVTETEDHNQDANISNDTISGAYARLVGTPLDKKYKATYAQDGSVVLGAQAHSGTPLGTAIGTNALVRKGAFGATAIGAGSQIQANAEAAVAIGMGAVANGAYAVAAGTASRAEKNAVATGYKADAGVSAVSVGDHSKAVESSVSVGQSAQSLKVADIAIGQGAIASGEQGAIAMGLGTQAQGDSSIMIGGSEINKVANQQVTYQKEKKDNKGHAVIKTTKKKEQIGGEEVERTIRSVEMENATGTIQQAYGELTNGATLTTTTLDYSKADNKNGHGSISMGIHSLSTGHLGTAIGTGARVTQLGGVALGTGAISELQNGVAIGTGSKADKNSVGTRQTDISYDEEGHIVPFDSKKVAYTFYWAGGTNTSEGDVVSFGTPGAERQLKNVAAGRIADDSTDAINGSQLNSVTKRMSSGWAVEAEKDHNSSGVLKLKGNEATGQSVNYATDGKSSTKGEIGTATGHVDKVRLNDEVKIRVGDNLVLNQENATRDAYEDPDNPDRKTGTHVTSKFTYSLNPELKKLKSADFKNDAGDTTTINGSGVTVTPVTAGKQPVSLTTTGLNNGGNAISNVAGNLPETKNNDAATGASNATTSQAAPTLGNAANQVNPTNAATVSDVLNAGWNLQGNNQAVDFVKPYDTVNFVNGDGTTVTVESTDGKTSTVKYSVNLGEGLKKDDNNNITVKAADKSLTVGNDGLKVNTGAIEPVTTGTNPGTVKVKDGDTGKIATVDSVVNAVNSAAWIATSAKTTAGELGAEAKDQSVKAGDKVTFEADKNIKITQAGSKFTFATRDDVSFNTVQVGGDQGPKLSKTDEGDFKVSGSNGTDPVKVTNVKSGLDTYGGNVPGKTAKNTGLVDLSKPTTGEPKVSDNTAATVGDLRNMGWVVSSDKTTGELTKAYTDQVKNADEVKFVGEGGVTVSGKTENGVRTITVKAEAQEMPEQPVSYTTADGTKVYPKTVTKPDGSKETKYYSNPEGTGNEIPKENVIASINGPEGTKAPTTLSNVAGNLDGAKKGTQAPITEHAPVNSTNAAGPNYVNPNNAATVGDVLNAGWNLQNNGTAKDFVKPYDTVNFVNGANTTAVVTTNADGTTSNVTYNVTGLPVTYTDAAGNKLAKIGDKYYKVNDQGQPLDEQGQPTTKVNDKGVPVNAAGQEIPSVDVANTSLVNPTPKNGKTSTTSPTTLNNVKSNLPTVNDADKNASDVNGAPIDGKNNTAAPITAKEAADLLNPTKDGQPNPKFAGNNAATVSDVLNAGWNLQNNGEARDFVKPYDTINFVNGANTTAVVTTSADGTTSNVTYNVTGLPVTYTTETGAPVSKVGDKFYTVDESGTPVGPTGKKAVGKNATGDFIDDAGNVIEPINTAANPLKSNLVNPNVANTTEKPNNQTTSPTQLGNVANGAETFKPADNVKLANDGKWYPADKVEPNGQPKTGAAPVPLPANIGKAGLIDFSKSSPNNAATVGDLQNLGWIVSAEGNKYSDQVRNANEVKFVGEGTASVTGKTDDKGVRTITVKVDDQVSTNNAQTPVNYTNKDGKKVYPVKDENGNVTYHTTPDGKGKGDETVPAGDVITSLNGPEGTTTPTTLNNVKNNIPSVNDADKKVTNPDGTEKGTAGNVANINKAPLTATEAADLLNPTKDGKPNPNFAGNNAATVSDVLNAGWNLQNNGEARDFVKPFDTVNFVNGGNTTAVVTTAADGTTSDVTFNVTGLPITYTTADGKPVSKVGDKYYPVNEKGQPIGPDGKPAVKTAPNGDLLDAAGNVIQPINTAKEPLKSNLVNPNVANTADASNNQTTTPTQLGNVANGAETFKPADDVKLANDGKWYPADQVDPNGKAKEGATPVASPLVTKNAAGDVLEKGNDGNWYKSSDLENGNPKPNATEQTPKSKPDNADKAGLINFENSNPNNAATVGDLQNMGFVVSAKDNGYTEQMRNANKVEFKGDNGVQVTGKTLADGTREITVALKEGRVTNDVLITDKDGTVTHGVRGEDGKIYTKDPKTGKATKEEIPVKPSDTVENDGNAYVTGNSVATAIQKSGWNIGIGSTDKAFSEEAKTYERVNPKDNVKYVNGSNTTVSMAVDAAEDKNGDTVTTTYVKVDVNRDLHIDSVTAGGPAKDGKPGKDGAMTVKDAKGNDGVSATAKDGKGTLTLKDAGKDGKDASQVDISTAKAPADLENTPKDAVRANDGNWYTPADVTVEVKDGKTVVTPKAGKTPIPNAPTMDRIQYTGTDGKPRNVATMDDGLRFVGDDGETISKPLNSTMEFTGGNRENGKPVAKADTTTGNIGVFHDNGKLSVQLAKDLEKMNSANFETPDGTSTKITGNGLSVTPETAKLKDPKTGKPILDKDGNPKVDSKKVVSFGGPTIMKDPKTGKPVVDSKTGKPVMESGISAGGQVMTNVAPGRISPTSTDAVNGSQLHAVASNLNNKINKVGKHADAGTASALAASNIPQAYTPGKSLVGIAAGSYQGQTGVAVGMSRISDNGKIIIRLSGTTNTQGRAGVAAGVGYQW